MGFIAAAVYDTNWDRAMIRLLGREPDQAGRTRWLMPRRLPQAVILVIGFAMSLLQRFKADGLLPASGEASRAD
jgi:hypothetical protein